MSTEIVASADEAKSAIQLSDQVKVTAQFFTAAVA